MDVPAAHRVLLVAVAALVAGCHRAEEAAPAAAGLAPRPGAPVVLISIDTLRSDRLPVYGYAGVATPAIDALAADSVVFERAYAHCPLTLPSHAALLTGRLPPENGVRDNAGYRLAADDPTYLPRLLSGAGYATGAAVSSYAIRGSTGLAQGFDFYDDAVDEEGGVWGPERDGRRTLAAALAWLDRVGPRPFFLFFHTYEPHLPHDPPEPFRSRYGATYEAEIAAADAVVGGLLDDLRRRGLYDGALIVLLSDHGEGLGDHGEKGHGIFLYREALQVPLVVKLPGSSRAGTVVSAPVQLIDVVPTVLELLGLPLPQGGGASLLRLVAGGELPERALYAETLYPRIHYGWSDLASLIEGRFHYVEAPVPELYDLEADPAERHDVLRDERGVYARLRQRLAAVERPFELPAEEDEETRTKLAALGYLAAPARASEGPLPDPKVALPRSLAEMEKAFNLYNEGEIEAAIPALERLVDDNPGMTDAWRHLGMALDRVGRPEEALTAFEEALRLSGGSPQVAVQIGMVLAGMGRLDEARRYREVAAEREPVLAAELGLEIALAAGDLDQALRLAAVTSGPDSVSPGARRRLGLALSDRGRHDEAIALLTRLAGDSGAVADRNALARALVAADRVDAAEPQVESVLAQAPANAQALELRGLIALTRGRPAAARDALARSLEADPRQANAWNLMGVARAQLRDVGGALDAWEKAVELDPEQWDSLYNLGLMAARAGDRQRALRALSSYVATAPSGRFATEIAAARRLLARLESSR